jgi:N-methylhydantoinase A
MFSRSIDLRYRRQTHDVNVPVGEIIDEAAMTDVVERFELRYEEIHGPGTGYRPAGIEATTVRLRATMPGIATPQTADAHQRETVPEAPRRRDVYFDGWCPEVPVHEASELAAGALVGGPALLEWPTTTLVVHPGQQARMLPGGHARLTFVRGA